ncbi:MAG TPA: aminopeptidase P family N-terminal domain-containing protein, partial [Microthrixaceae bacterium]|nr:aminopeptidase P family N-terminal domain-containing protein [Microthrixaceae bacterium]
MSVLPTKPLPTDALPPLMVGPRLDRLRASLSEAGCDALLLTHLTNIRYLTGFTGSAALLLVSADDALMVTDGRYGEQAADQLGSAGAGVRLEVSGDGQREIVTAAAAGAGTVGLEAEHVSWA